MKRHLLLSLMALLALATLSGCKVAAGCALPFAAIGDTLITPLNGCKWCADKLIEAGDEHEMKVFEETRNTTYGDLAYYTAYVYYIPGYLFWPFGTIAPEELYPMTKSCLATINGDNTSAAKANEANERYESYQRMTGKAKDTEDTDSSNSEEDSFKEW